MKHITVASYITKYMLKHKQRGDTIELYYHYEIEMEKAEVAMLTHGNKLKQIINAKPHTDNDIRPSAALYKGWGKMNGYATFNSIRRNTNRKKFFGTDSRFVSDEESELNQGVKELLFNSYNLET